MHQAPSSATVAPITLSGRCGQTVWRRQSRIETVDPYTSIRRTTMCTWVAIGTVTHRTRSGGIAVNLADPLRGSRRLLLRASRTTTGLYLHDALIYTIGDRPLDEHVTRDH